MTIVSQEMLKALNATGGTTRPKALPNWLWPLWRHAGMTREIQKGSSTLYFVPDAGRGMHLNVLEARLMNRYQHILLHHHVFSYFDKYDARFAKFLNALPPRISHIMLSRNMVDAYRAIYGREDDAHVLGNSPFVQKPAILRHRDRVKRIGFLSNITAEKGVREAIETAQKMPETEFHFAGPANPDVRNMLSRFVKASPLKRKWHGAIYGPQKTQFFRDIDVLLFPTRYPNEAQPLVIFEALAAGVPVLATPRGCIPEQLATPAWVLDQDTFSQEAARLISRWVNQPKSYARAVQHAKSVFEQHLTRDTEALKRVINRFGA